MGKTEWKLPRHGPSGPPARRDVPAEPRVRVGPGGARAAGTVPGSQRRGTKPGRPPAAASLREGAPRARRAQLGSLGEAGARVPRPHAIATSRAGDPTRLSRGKRAHSLISMLGNKERWQLHAQETLGCPAAAAAAVPLTPIKRSRAARGARREARLRPARGARAPHTARGAARARGAAEVPGACWIPRQPSGNPGAAGRGRRRRVGHGRAAGARSRRAQPARRPICSRAPPPAPHSSPRRSGCAARPRSEAGRRSDVSARRGCRFPPRGGRGGGARCANPRRRPPHPPRPGGRARRARGGLLKGPSPAPA